MTLKEMRKKAGLTQAELSEKTGINLQVIQRYEIGVRDIKKAAFITVYKLVTTCKSTCEDFMKDEKNG